MSNVEKNIIGFDYGDKNIGVARVNTVAKIPEPLTELKADDDIALDALIDKHQPDLLVVGLPRNLSSQDTAQTASARQFAKSLEKYGLDVILQDEALSTVEAERRRSHYKDEISLDSIAATIILEDYLKENVS